MKQFFLTLVVALVTLTSCSSDEEKVLEFNKYLFTGDWRATSIKATFANGDVITITDWVEIQDELDGLEWVQINTNTDELIVVSSWKKYSFINTVEDGKLVITSPELVMSIDVVSGKDDEIVVQYTSPSQSYTSLITYKKIGGKDIAAKDVIGEWKANKVIVTNGGDTTITDENTIKKVLDGLDWIKLTNNTLVLMDTGISYSYSISNNELVTSPTGELQGRVIFYIVEKNDVVVYYSSHSYSGYIVYGRV